MSNERHRILIDYYERCFAQHGDSHLGVAWPNADDVEKRYKVMLEVMRDPADPSTLLDFGCGAAHLYEYMRRNSYANISYHGLDASPAFCALSRAKYPDVPFHCVDVLSNPEALENFDFIVINGVFTVKRELSFDEMYEYLKRVLRIIFPKARRGVAFNVMSKAVDWEREDLFHLPIDLLVGFLKQELSRHIVIRHDYGLYEYTAYVYRAPSE
jgi:SAM-dependent methyltransferase